MVFQIILIVISFFVCSVRTGDRSIEDTLRRLSQVEGPEFVGEVSDSSLDDSDSSHSESSDSDDDESSSSSDEDASDDENGPPEPFVGMGDMSEFTGGVFDPMAAIGAKVPRTPPRSVVGAKRRASELSPSAFSPETRRKCLRASAEEIRDFAQESYLSPTRPTRLARLAAMHGQTPQKSASGALRVASRALGRIIASPEKERKRVIDPELLAQEYAAVTERGSGPALEALKAEVRRVNPDLLKMKEFSFLNERIINAIHILEGDESGGMHYLDERLADSVVGGEVWKDVLSGVGVAQVRVGEREKYSTLFPQKDKATLIGDIVRAVRHGNEAEVACEANRCLVRTPHGYYIEYYRDKETGIVKTAFPILTYAQHVGLGGKWTLLDLVKKPVAGGAEKTGELLVTKTTDEVHELVHQSLLQDTNNARYYVPGRDAVIVEIAPVLPEADGIVNQGILVEIPSSVIRGMEKVGIVGTREMRESLYNLLPLQGITDKE